MAWINAALRALEAALFHLTRGESPLGEDIAANVRDARQALIDLQGDAEAPLRDVGDPEAALLKYRVALEPSKREILRCYRSLLSGSLPPEVQQAQADLAKALDALEQAVPAMPPVQDSYSLRCAPQVLGAARQALDHVEQVLVTEANSATDNPLIFPPERGRRAAARRLGGVQGGAHARAVSARGVLGREFPRRARGVGDGLSGHRLGRDRQHRGAARGAHDRRAPQPRAAELAGVPGGFELGVHDPAVHGGRAGEREQDLGAPRERGLHPQL
jgi:hypothetical protein